MNIRENQLNKTLKFESQMLNVEKNFTIPYWISMLSVVCDEINVEC